MTAPPLRGSLIVSVGHTLPGMYCIGILRDLGATVVRVERLRNAGDAGPYANLPNRFPTASLLAGTSSIELDLKNDHGLRIFRGLCANAQAVMEGFRPGVAARLGIDHETLRRDRPELVVASVSGYGQSGPLADRVGHDINYLAETGVLDNSNPAGLPGVTFADGVAGISTALNILAALVAAEHSGQGQYLDLAIVDAPMYLMSSELEHFAQTGTPRTAGDTHLTGSHPWYGVHRTADDGAVAVGAVEPQFHDALCSAIGHPELAAMQYADGPELEQATAAYRDVFARRTRDEAMDLFADADACVSPVLAVDEVAASPLMDRVRRDADGEPDLIRSPVRTDGASLPDPIGTRELLERAGFSAAEMAEAQEQGGLGPDD